MLQLFSIFLSLILGVAVVLSHVQLCSYVAMYIVYLCAIALVSSTFPLQLIQYGHFFNAEHIKIISRKFSKLFQILFHIDYEIVDIADGAKDYLYMQKTTSLEQKEKIEKPSCIFISNHQSSIDFIGLMYMWNNYFLKCTIMAKNMLKFAGPFGMGALFYGVLFIDRSKRQKDKQRPMDNFVQQILKNEQQLFVFPEGTRSHSSDQLQPFRKGAFNIAVEGQIPIIPIVFSGYHHFYQWRKFFRRRGKVLIQILPPIYTKNISLIDVPVLADETRNSMQKCLNELNNKIDKN
ncbi:hypothetical protein SNEBB_003531 [Seison nebaliae]|nr:hypothetical protein SNEBB_003531 [Seison nebaliae]